MNGIDRFLDAEYARQLSDLAVEKERERLAALPQTPVLGLDGRVEYKYVPETKTYPLLNVEPPSQEKLAKRDPYAGMSIPYNMVNPHYPEMSQKALYTREYLEEFFSKLKNGSKRDVGLSDFESDRVKMSFK